MMAFWIILGVVILILRLVWILTPEQASLHRSPGKSAQARTETRCTGIVWMGEARVASGECQVCGAWVRERLVWCKSCGTPHHEECWEYAGGCSTFACGERRYFKRSEREA